MVKGVAIVNGEIRVEIGLIARLRIAIDSTRLDVETSRIPTKSRHGVALPHFPGDLDLWSLYFCGSATPWREWIGALLLALSHACYYRL